MEKRIRKTPPAQDIILLGKRIQSIMKVKGMKPIDVAASAGLETQNLRKYLNGTQEMKVTTLMKIAMALEVQFSDLLPTLEYPKKAVAKKQEPKKVYPK